MGSQKSCVNVDHIAQDRWGPPLVDADWHAYCQAVYNGIEGRRLGVILRLLQKEMSRAAGVKKPNENQKPKALWKIKAAKDR